MYKILIVEDDLVIANSLVKHLSGWNFETRLVQDFNHVLSEFIDYDPHLVLLDITLPYYNGYYWCNEIRKLSKVPIVFISSASENMNIVMAMNMGGDDFISKPFDLNVVVAKVQAIVRRAYSFGGHMNVIEHNDVILDLNGDFLMFNNKKIELTRNEFRILQILFENSGKIVTRDAIMARLWESDSFIDDNTLTVNMTRLRKKLEEAGLENFILTRKGQGYTLS